MLKFIGQFLCQYTHYYYAPTGGAPVVGRLVYRLCWVNPFRAWRSASRTTRLQREYTRYHEKEMSWKRARRSE